LPALARPLWAAPEVLGQPCRRGFGGLAPCW